MSRLIERIKNVLLGPDLLGQGGDPRLPGWLEVLIGIIVAFVVITEFSFDLGEKPQLHTTVLALDVTLLAGFVLWKGLQALANHRRLMGWLYDQRIELLFLGIALFAAVFSPRAGAVPILTRLTITGVVRLVRYSLGSRTRVFGNLSPSQTLAMSFVGLISLGAILLMFPAATTDGRGANFTDAMFTMSSATSVTGLVVQDTDTYWTFYGKVVLLFVMQTGAIGIMVLAASFAVLVGGRLPGREQEGLNEAGFGDVMDVATIEGLKRLATAVATMTIIIELIGAIILYVLWLTDLMPLRDTYNTPAAAAWWCLFHSVSAFCHAGFSFEPDSLMRYVDSPFVCGVFIILITLGAVGFPVLADLYYSVIEPRQKLARFSLRRTWNSFHIQTRVVLVATAILYVVGMLGFLFFEYNVSLAGLSVPSKLNAALFQSVTLRSAGFNTVSWEHITGPTLILSVVFMFVGSAPGSTGGGVRVTTAAVVVMAVRAMLLGREDVELYGRTLPKAIVYRSIAIVLVGGVFVAGGLVLVTATQNLPLDKLIFETLSAYGTVGLSMGITADLDTTGRWLMTGLMYIGRVGPLTLALAVGARAVPKTYRYPEGKMAVG